MDHTMANFVKTITQTLIIACIFSFSILTSTQATFGRPIYDEEAQQLGLNFKNEKLTHFKLFWHDILSGPNPTSVMIVSPFKNSSTSFGMINMIDDPLTEGPKFGSKIMGQAQGFYALSSQKYFGLLMAMNFAFSEGKYNGSSITVLGRNAAENTVREMPVVGGSGLFRFARGYVQAKTHTFNNKNGDAIVQYDCYVLHY